jgi:regulatory protein
MDAIKARRYLFWLLARRDYSCAEIRQKLKLKGTALEIVDRLIEEFQQKGYLNDQRRAQSLVQAALTKKKGPRYIAQKLQQKGIASTLIQEATAGYSEEEQKSAIHALLETRYAKYDLTDPQARQKAYLALCRQGFSTDLIISMINEESYD